MPFTDPEKKRLYDQKWNKAFYLKNRESEMRRVAKRKQELRDWLNDYKKQLACQECGESDPVCLDFHHRDAKEKEFSLGNVKDHGWGKERLLHEIQKCVVVCSNCHRKLHAKMAKGT